jgi:TRAP-type C4-dicarboxylate transport system permease small subunit
VEKTSLASTVQKRAEIGGKLLAMIEDGFGFIAGFCLIFITIIILASVAGRYFEIYVGDADELSTYMMVMIAYLPAAGCLRRGEFVVVDLVIRLLPSAARNIVLVVTNLFSSLVVIVIAHACFGLFIESYRSGLVSNSLLKVPLYLPQAPIVIGAALLTIRMVITTWGLFRHSGKKNLKI